MFDRLTGPRYSRIISFLIGTILFVFFVPLFIPHARGSPGETLTVDPQKGKVKDRVFISGKNYAPGEKIYLYLSGDKGERGDRISDLLWWKWIKTVFADRSGWTTAGQFSTTFKVPEILEHGPKKDAVSGGLFYIYATYKYKGDIVVAIPFSVTGIKDAIPSGGEVGSKVVISGYGFDAERDINVFYDGQGINISYGDTETDEEGNFRLFIIIPPGVPGDHSISVEIGREEDETTFTIK